MADSPVLYVYYRPDNDDAYPGVPARHITEADWARFSPSQRRIVQEATTQDGYGRRKVWVHIDLVDETEQERAEREAREQAAREAYERGQSIVRWRDFEPLVPGPGEVIVGTASGPVSVPVDSIGGGGQREQRVTFVSGQPHEQYTCSGCTQSVDLEHSRLGGTGTKLTTTGAVTATARTDINGGDPLTIPPAAAITLWVYVPEPDLVSQVTVDIYPHGGGPTWTRSSNVSGGLKAGWNRLRWGANEATRTNWANPYRVRFSIYATGATSVTIGHMYAECPPKASLVVIQDTGYLSFYERGYPALQARRVPVTWAVDPARLGTEPGFVMTPEDLRAAMESGNGDSVSFHGWTGAPTADMTPDQIREDVVRAQQWLSHQGYRGGYWRAAWVQNLATNADAARDLLVMGASHTASSSYNIWPPKDRYNMPRQIIHGASRSVMDGRFATLKETHQLALMYTHGVSEAGGMHVTPEEWEYFLHKIDEGMREGWLECVTMDTLMARSGAVWRTGMGETILEYYDEQGVLRQYRPV